MVTKTILIGGMTCINCQSRIEKRLRETAGIQSAVVDYKAGKALISYDEESVTLNEIEQIIESLNYKLLKEGEKTQPLRALGFVFIIFAVYMLLRQLGFSAISGNFPLAEAGADYGVLLLIGLLTSVHCVAMCGGINLSQCITKHDVSKSVRRPVALVPAILYNGGRVISYTMTGVIVGALGSVITVTGAMQGFIQVAAGVFMIIMALNMLDIFPALRRITPHLPAFLANKINSQKAVNKGPLFVGLLNGLMPCGPLQAMQLYALSTGSPLNGGLSMFFFSIGTVPLMFGVGALSSLLSKRFTALVLKVGAVMVAALGLTMLSNGWALGGFSFKLPAVYAAPLTGGNAVPDNFQPLIENGVQIVNSKLSSGRYPAITVQQGVPVRWIIDVPQGSLNGCNNRMVVREYGIEYKFKTGENIIEFTPEKAGKFSYSCWMGMIRSSITVVEKGGSIADIPDASEPKPAGVQIPTEEVALGKIENGIQTITINLNDEGISPAIAVMQKNIKTKWIINNSSLDAGNAALVFPLYYAQLPMETGENELALLPTDDFEFSTLDNVFYGFVKVVDDINNIDIPAIQKEAAEHETLIYPDEYFAQAQGGGCCAQ
ncbi:MAG: sulfite exporter TauE/SafE family protein [Spirochaetaceae bacterium]|nr:sulfite exporter TauE/SafE family protein [Spirochaetaceae bacterium]